MSVIKLIIADENKSYTRGLAQYLLEECGQVFQVICFTQANILMEYLSKSEEVDILLINPQLLSKDISKNCAKCVVLLVENVDNDSKNSIYKFQKADQIKKLLLQEYDKISNCGINVLNSNAKCKFISVYSSSGAAGKTTIAYNLAIQYSMKAKKVLYISLEAYSALSIFHQHESSRGVIYLLYLIKSKLPNLMLKLNTIINTDSNTNVSFLEREKNVLEYKDIKIEDFTMLSDFLKNQSDFEAVILDLDSSMNEMTLGAFKVSDIIINVMSDDQVSCAKQEKFKEQIAKISNLLGLDISSKLLSVRNKSISPIKSENSIVTLEIPYMQSNPINLGAYFPEMTYFNQLYDAVENSYSTNGEVI
jgi:cellulose biosynthesis protein BcsQ